MSNPVELTSYQTIRNIISANSNPLNAASIRNMIWQTVGRGKDEDYVNTISYFFNVAIRNGDPDTKKIFREVFCDDLIKYCTFYEPVVIAMQLEGLDDIILVDLKVRRVPEDEDALIYELLLPKMKEIFYHAKYEIPLLIVGETGTSKELLAKTIHTLSSRRNGPFQEINCAAIPETIFESELFGVIPNYPGFHNPSGMLGKIKLANDGILFLDELGKMGKRLQYKILRSLEDQSITPLGAEKPDPVNVRFIAATQPNDMKNILPDLKYRLGYPDIIKTTTLNERIDMVGDFIIKHTLAGIRKKMGLRYDSISLSRTVKKILLNRRYEGNYRELENILRGALILALGDNRNEIITDDVNTVIERMELSSGPDKTNVLQTDGEQKEIGVTDIIDYADKIKASIIEDRLLNFLKTGRDLKSAFLSENKTENDYQNFLKKVKKITGKGIRDLGKMPSLTH